MDCLIENLISNDICHSLNPLFSLFLELKNVLEYSSDNLYRRSMCAVMLLFFYFKSWWVEFFTSKKLFTLVIKLLLLGILGFYVCPTKSQLNQLLASFYITVINICLMMVIKIHQTAWSRPPIDSSSCLIDDAFAFLLCVWMCSLLLFLFIWNGFDVLRQLAVASLFCVHIQIIPTTCSFCPLLCHFICRICFFPSYFGCLGELKY